MRALLWFRGTDLRLHDHPAVQHACAHAAEVVPVFVLSPRYFEGAGAENAPHRIAYLLDALHELSAGLAERGSQLLCVRGPAERVIPELAARLQVDEVLACASTEPAARARDAIVQARLQLPLRVLDGETLTPPGSLRTAAGEMFQVFTPFARAFLARVQVEPPQKAPKRMPPLASGVDRRIATAPPTLEALGLSRNPRLILGGQTAARARLLSFLRRGERYHIDRDRMDQDATSRISADLRFGTLSARTAFHEAERYLLHEAKPAYDRFIAELLWREFAHHWLWRRPQLLQQPFRRDFSDFPYRQDDAAWCAWTEGRTGYPVVDASARQLLAEGYVHNRARMISASFLTKHLLIHYARGEGHYAKWLVDYDPASNNQGWQWSAGCGCDAQPYFRVFNPVSQGQRFDPEGEYVRRWVPELRGLPTKYIHAPWTASGLELRAADVTLGVTYPHPVVDHAQARARFLQLAKQHLQSGR